MGNTVRTVAIGSVLGALLAGGTQLPSVATSTTGWPVAPGSFGIMYGSTDSTTISAVRAWEAATWCTVQPTEGADMQAILASTLGPQLDSHLATGAATAIVGLGHPPAWVFNNAASAKKRVIQYGCADHGASGVSIPTYESLKPRRGGALPLQAQRWSTYVGAVIDFLDSRYGESLTILLQVWNEPNLKSGLSVKTGVKGASSTLEDAVNSLYELEKLTAQAVRTRGNPAITLTSTALHQRPNKFSRLYLAKQGRKPVVSSLAFNVYGYKTRTPDSMVRQWDQRVHTLRTRVNAYPKLRRLPALLGETNLNLVNNTYDKSNLARAVINPDAQRRLAASVQMNAFYHGFQSVYWLSGPQAQAAVLIGRESGTPARSALTVLRGELLGMTIDGCRTRAGVRVCSFVDPTAARPPLKVYWRMSKTSHLTLSGASTIVYMTGEAIQVGPGKLLVGTTPIVVKPALIPVS